MTTEVTLGSEALNADREDLREVAQVLVERGEMEVVTTVFGEVLDIRQSPDEGGYTNGGPCYRGRRRAALRAGPPALPAAARLTARP